ncbi:MAG: metallopeptidase family protein [Peptococcaceae bacterium]|nr:metallopeptidase family protein [Peptococcaceae bacterium]
MSSKKRAALTLDQFESLATACIDEIPEKLCARLNGGFLLLPEAKKEGDFYIMGEYLEDGVMGCSIILYYGSFVELLAESSREEWEKELRDTIVHELRHHLESMAGVDDLAREEMAELEELLKNN